MADDRATSAARLGPHTTLGVGGPARRLAPVASHAALLETLAGVPDRRAASLLVLGQGSNVVVSDAGFPGTVLLLHGGTREARALADGSVELVVDAGVDWDELVGATVEAGCTGLELLSGIPGRVGAAPIQNIAAYGQQVCDAITVVEVVDRSTLELIEIPADECGFGFRTSRFKAEWRDRYVVARVWFRLAQAAAAPPEPSTYVDIVKQFERTGGDPTDVTQRRAAVRAARRSKSMILDPADPLTSSVGSFFINPTVPVAFAHELAERFPAARLPVQYLEGRAVKAPASVRVPAALLLRAAGFHPGDRWGPVQLSDRHVLAVVTRPGARALDVWNVGSHVRRKVREATGVELEFEATFLGDFPPFDAAAFARSTPFEPAADAEPAWLVGYR